MTSNDVCTRHLMSLVHRFPEIVIKTQELNFKVMLYSLLMNYSYETVFVIGLKVYCCHKFQ